MGCREQPARRKRRAAAPFESSGAGRFASGSPCHLRSPIAPRADGPTSIGLRCQNSSSSSCAKSVVHVRLTTRSTRRHGDYPLSGPTPSHRHRRRVPGLAHRHAQRARHRDRKPRRFAASRAFPIKLLALSGWSITLRKPRVSRSPRMARPWPLKVRCHWVDLSAARLLTHQQDREIASQTPTLIGLIESARTTSYS
jgi:hypothetical protein